MNSFWILTGFEFKKIIRRKAIIFAILIMVFMSTFCIVGDIAMSERGISVMEKERDLVHKVAGYVDEKMIDDVIKNNVIAKATTLSKYDSYPDGIVDKHILPYGNLRRSMISIFSPIDIDYEKFNSLESGKGIDFYAVRTAGIEAILKKLNLPESEIKATLNANDKLTTPFYYDSFEGYTRFLLMMSISGVFIILALSMCIAPIFSDEYQKKTDAIILSSKYGKSKLIKAKIFTVTIFSIVFTLVALIIALITNFSVYSTIGGDASIQIWKTFSVYPLTMAKTVMVYCGIIICVAMIISSLCAILSAYFNSFATIVTVMALLIGSMIINVPFENLRILNYFLPAKMINTKYIFSDRLLSVFGIYMEPYIFIFILCLVVLAICLPLSYRKFKNHQVV